jgi:hypothetical protein
MSEPIHRPTRAERAESVVLVSILLVVGLAAGAASFTHVHDWTMTNSPAGTPDWFGWVNACISELVPVAALIETRRRRRAGKATGFPLALLVAAAGLSLSAQLAVAKPGVSGALLSAVPAIAFMALVKLIFSSTPATATAASTATAAEVTATAAPEVTATATSASTATTATAARPPATATPPTAAQAATAAPEVTASATGTRRPRSTSPGPRGMAAAPADDMAARVAELLADRPSATVEQVASAIGRAPRTARRYVSAARAGMATRGPAGAAA